jgi:hypothetical protein
MIMNLSRRFRAVKITRILFMLVACGSCSVLITSCQPVPIEVTVVDCSAQNFRIQLTEGKRFIFWGDPAPATIDSATFYHNRNNAEASQLWRIEQFENASGKKLGTFNYGTTPVGFIGTQAKPLQPGQTVFIMLKAVESTETELKVCQ